MQYASAEKFIIYLFFIITINLSCVAGQTLSSFIILPSVALLPLLAGSRHWRRELSDKCSVMRCEAKGTYESLDQWTNTPPQLAGCAAVTQQHSLLWFALRPTNEEERGGGGVGGLVGGEEWRQEGRRRRGKSCIWEEEEGGRKETEEKKRRLAKTENVEEWKWGR